MEVCSVIEVNKTTDALDWIRYWKIRLLCFKATVMQISITLNWKGAPLFTENINVNGYR